VHWEVSDGDCGDCMLVLETMALGKIGSRVWVGWSAPCILNADVFPIDS